MAECGSSFDLRRFFPCGILLLVFGVALPAAVPAQVGIPYEEIWDTPAMHPGDPNYFQPPYPIAFVAAKLAYATSPQNPWDHIGTDVLSANNPGEGHHLYILLTNGQVKKLFPLDKHYSNNVVDNQMLGVSLDRGSVVEPNMSENGKWIYFSYYHDADNNPQNRAYWSKLIESGADIYRIDLTKIINDNNYDPQNLTVQRLTNRTYVGGAQNPNDWMATAMNWGFAQSTTRNDWGTSYLHPVEMRKEGKLKLVYVSDEKRLHNSNLGGFANHNFNLHMADVTEDGRLVNQRQFQYYTTTSALSPAPLRNGIAFSYQASTEDDRLWHIQALDSAGRWFPLMGYGTNPFLFHLGTFCVDTKTTTGQTKDMFIGTRYYNLNNEGFGSLWRQDLAEIGLNTYNNNTGHGTIPVQEGQQRITLNVIEDDKPSGKNSAGKYYGKFTSPRCGGPDELYMAWSPTSANTKVPDPEGKLHHYRSKITFRPNLKTFDPLETVDLAQEKGQRIVVADLSDTYTLVWPTPVISWQQRSGDAIQKSAPQIIDPNSAVTPGDPFAQVGTSALYNTDRKPFDCWLSQNNANLAPYNPNCSGQPKWSSGNCPGLPSSVKCYCDGNINRENDLVVLNQAGLTYVQDPNDLCKDLQPSEVLGIAVNITSNKADTTFPAYQTYGSTSSNYKEREAVKLLGVYDTRSQPDQSFQAMIPAHVPFEFHLLSSTYGLKLADVRSWHSLQVRETRTDCGGCHQHEPGGAIPYAGTWASQNPPLDMVSETKYLDYDPACNPVLLTDSSAATLHVPEWRELWQDPTDPTVGFNAYCASCHNPNLTTADPNAVQVFGFTNEAEAFDQLWTRHYAVPRLGALGSPAFWAAYGARTDGRDNNHAKFAKYIGPPQRDRWPYKTSAVHATTPGLCGQNDQKKASWVYRFGQWIDNQMPRNEQTGSGATNYHFDWYHPTVDFAIVEHSDTDAVLVYPECDPSTLRVGYWDDTGSVAEVKLERVSPPLLLSQVGATPNGKHFVSTSGLLNSQVLRATVKDAAGNVQKYEKRVSELIAECFATHAVETELPYP